MLHLLGGSNSLVTRQSIPVMSGSPASPHSPRGRFIALRHADLGQGFTVARALPTREQRMVGAWCFLDRIGPVDLTESQGMHVGAHPHTGLQTFTWMVHGRVLHRDSLGSEQVIQPGQVNLMTAGQGIVHTEDSLPGSTRLLAAQLWIALPAEKTDMAAAFTHYPVLPQWGGGAANSLQFTLLAGEFSGYRAPTMTHSPLMGMDIHALRGDETTLSLRTDFEYGILPLEGQVLVDGQTVTADRFLYLPAGEVSCSLELPAGSRCLVLGGGPFAQPISMWWNFVGPTRAYVEQAQADWLSGSSRFPVVQASAAPRLPAPPIPWVKT